MARKMKPATNQNINLGEDLRNTFNSDDWHKLFDILVEYEEEVVRLMINVGRLIQKYIEKQFARHSFPWKTESKPIDFFASPSSTTSELKTILSEIIQRLTRYLVRQKSLSKMKPPDCSSKSMSRTPSLNSKPIL